MAKLRHESATGSSARARFIWVSPSKVREVTSLIRGKHIDEARRILAFTPKAASRHLAKVLESAVANAEHNYQIPQEELIVRGAWADEGAVSKRAQARARGARSVIRRRTSHINVVLERAQEAQLAVPLPARRSPDAAAPAAQTQEPKPSRPRRSKKAGAQGETPPGKRATKKAGAQGETPPAKRATRRSNGPKVRPVGGGD